MQWKLRALLVSRRVVGVKRVFVAGLLVVGFGLAPVVGGSGEGVRGVVIERD